MPPRSRSPDTVLAPLHKLLQQAKDMWPEAFEKKLRFGDVMGIMKACDIKFAPDFVIAIGRTLGTTSGPADVLRNHCADLVDMEMISKDGSGNVAPNRFTPRKPPLPGIEGKDAMAKAWNDEKGFGFVAITESGEEAYVHRTALCDGDYLSPGSLVRVKISWNESRGKNEVKACSGAIAKGAGKGSPMQAQESGTCCFIGNLPYDTTEDELLQICKSVGNVKSVQINRDLYKRLPNLPAVSCGFCDFADTDIARLAIEALNGIELRGRTIRVCSSEGVAQPVVHQKEPPRIEHPVSMPESIQEEPTSDPKAEIREAGIDDTGSLSGKRSIKSRREVVKLPVGNRRKWRLLRRLEELGRHNFTSEEDCRPDTPQLLAGVQKQILQELPSWAREVDTWTCAKPPTTERLQELISIMREHCRQEDADIRNSGTNEDGNKSKVDEATSTSSREFLDSLPAQLLPLERRLFEKIHSWMVEGLQEKPEESLLLSDVMETESVRVTVESLLGRHNVSLEAWIERRLEGKISIGLDALERYIVLPILPDDASMQVLRTSQPSSLNTDGGDLCTNPYLLEFDTTSQFDHELDNTRSAVSREKRGVPSQAPDTLDTTLEVVHDLHNTWSAVSKERRGVPSEAPPWRNRATRDFERKRFSRSRSRSRGFGSRGRFHRYGGTPRRDRSRSRGRRRDYRR